MKNAIPNAALLAAIAAIIPIAGSFTPALYVSGCAALTAVLVILSGHFRRGVLTLYFAVSAAIVSPVLGSVQRAEFWLVMLTAFGVVAGVILYLDFRHRSAP